MDYAGSTISHYHIIEKLGQGGMATVYRAYDTRLERDVAIKLVRKEAIPPEQLERILKRFEREAKSLAKFLHPHIVPVHDFGEHNGAPYLVMAYLPGGTLKEQTGKPMLPAKALQNVIPIADALGYAHKHGVIHRDVKPSNILVTEDGVVMLSDFGIARLLEESTTQLTATGMGVGTPEYMAPEQWIGQATEASDQYALAVVLYELLTGKKPFTADTPMAVALKAMQEPLPRPSQIIPGIPEAVEKVLYKAMARQAEDRYRDMEEMGKVLRGLIAADTPASPGPENSDPAHRQQLSIARALPSDDGETRDEWEDSQTLINRPPQNGQGKDQDRIQAESSPNATSQSALVENENIARAKQQSIPMFLHDIPDENTTAEKKRNPFSPWLLWGGIGLALLSLIIVVMSQLLQQKPDTTNSPLAVVETLTETVTETIIPTNQTTVTPTLTETLTATPSPTSTPTRALISIGVVSTMVRGKDGMEMVYVPEGAFIMGSYEGLLDQQPEHNIYLDAYWIDKFEVTNGQYKLCVADGACYAPHIWESNTREDYYNNLNFSDYPVIYMSWDDAQAYCEWAGGNLPTEAQWEKAARGIDGRRFPWGYDDPSCGWLNFDDCVEDTTAIGSYPAAASPYGALDMAGNVREWVWDRYSFTYYQLSPFANPEGPIDGAARVLRGGSWASGTSVVQTAFRSWGGQHDDYRYYSAIDIGFRCAVPSAGQ